MQQTGTTSRVRAVLGPLTDRLERLERRATPDADELVRIKAAAREAGMRGMRYGLLVALAVVSPRDAIKQLLAYVDGAEGAATVMSLARANDEPAQLTDETGETETA